MRRFALALCLVLLPLGAGARESARLSPYSPGSAGPAVCTVAPTSCLNYDDAFHRNCGSRGGPGCRKAGGQCAAWRDGFTPDCRALGNRR